MPIDPITGTIIGTGIQMAGNAINNKRNREQAEAQRNWSQKMQHDQNDFNRRQWELNNKYNSPIEQMARFKEAGLNPHLIYGKGTPGNATPIKSADVKPYSRAESKSVTQGLDVFNTYNQQKNIQAQTDNVEASASVHRQTALLKGLEFKKESKNEPYYQEYADANLLKLQSEARKGKVDADIAENTKDDVMKIVTAKLAQINSQTTETDFNSLLKDLDYDFKRHGVTNKDDYMKHWIVIHAKKNGYDPMNYLAAQDLATGVKDLLSDIIKIKTKIKPNK